jgi:hypothetical protein
MNGWYSFGERHCGRLIGEIALSRKAWKRKNLEVWHPFRYFRPKNKSQMIS